MLIFMIITAYFVIGYLCIYVFFPEKKPDIATYFKPGQVFRSEAEGAVQTILRQEGGIVYCSAVLEPYAPGPPKHYHSDFEETFAIANGELSFWIDGQVKKIRPGQKIHVPKGVPHKPYNETGESIVVAGEVAFPEKFAFYLCQVYGIIDRDPSIVRSPRMALQMSLLQQAGFNATLVEAPPVFIQHLSSFVLAPLARLMGYRSYYKEFDPKLETQNSAVLAV
ncbi:MAG: cupin domain-containing protein [Sphingobacteriales bacterium]|nr:MAG: cupin domain-containing protein [Sphingobacteriales bacterium]